MSDANVALFWAVTVAIFALGLRNGKGDEQFSQINRRHLDDRSDYCRRWRIFKGFKRQPCYRIHPFPFRFLPNDSASDRFRIQISHGFCHSYNHNHGTHHTAHCPAHRHFALIDDTGTRCRK